MGRCGGQCRFVLNQHGKRAVQVGFAGSHRTGGGNPAHDIARHDAEKHFHRRIALYGQCGQPFLGRKLLQRIFHARQFFAGFRAGVRHIGLGGHFFSNFLKHRVAGFETAGEVH